MCVLEQPHDYQLIHAGVEKIRELAHPTVSLGLPAWDLMSHESLPATHFSVYRVEVGVLRAHAGDRGALHLRGPRLRSPKISISEGGRWNFTPVSPAKVTRSIALGECQSAPLA